MSKSPASVSAGPTATAASPSEDNDANQTSVDELLPADFDIKEQDRWLPIANGEFSFFQHVLIPAFGSAYQFARFRFSLVKLDTRTPPSHPSFSKTSQHMSCETAKLETNQFLVSIVLIISSLAICSTL